MRRTLSTAVVSALAIMLLSNSAWAQSGTRGIVPGPVNVPNAVQALSSLPTVTATPPMSAAPMLQMEQAMPSQAMMSAPAMIGSEMNSPTMAAPMMQAPSMSYTGPVTGSYSPGPASSSYAPVSVGPYPQGRACCDLSPTPTVTPCLKPVTSCCSQNGKLGVPPLLTPIRYDMPPVGRSVGRPLFGKWTGY